jgi:hypothetical protein
LQKLKEEEENSLREFAKKNGFTFNDPSAKKKELDDIYAEAANFKITKVVRILAHSLGAGCSCRSDNRGIDQMIIYFLAAKHQY